MVGPGPAIFRRHQHAHKAEFSEFGERLFRKPRLAVPFGRMRREFVAGEFAGRVAQQALLVGEPHPVTFPAGGHLDLDLHARIDEAAEQCRRGRTDGGEDFGQHRHDPRPVVRFGT